ncbi:DUF6328 family protein [Nocardioides perillae]|uniref:Sodium:proton antiporter n=1 Tax=Nocardioides perillae TaxID=1119534 RepID=A0A7Y9RUY7_9ACTN|nr:hypothetical protein [Nocardioides perillae]
MSGDREDGYGGEVHPDRDETPTERLDRHWGELLQELRVMQTGTQLIAGFLLTLPFADRFEETGAFERVLYLGLVVLAAVTTATMLAPIALHRRLYGGHARDRLVRTTHYLVAAALGGIALLLVGIVALVFSFVVSTQAAVVATACVGAVALLLLLGVPTAVERAGRD